MTSLWGDAAHAAVFGASAAGIAVGAGVGGAGQAAAVGQTGAGGGVTGPGVALWHAARISMKTRNAPIGRIYFLILLNIIGISSNQVFCNHVGSAESGGFVN